MPTLSHLDLFRHPSNEGTLNSSPSSPQLPLTTVSVYELLLGQGPGPHQSLSLNPDGETLPLSKGTMYCCPFKEISVVTHSEKRIIVFFTCLTAMWHFKKTFKKNSHLVQMTVF